MTMTRIAIRNISGFDKLKNVLLPIVVNAKYFYEGCHLVYAEEFRAYVIDEKMPEANGGRGLLHSFYGEGKYKVVISEKSNQRD
jgi:hypothetical protein